MFCPTPDLNENFYVSFPADANDTGASEDGNLTRLPDGSTIFLYGGGLSTWSLIASRTAWAVATSL